MQDSFDPSLAFDKSSPSDTSWIAVDPNNISSNESNQDEVVQFEQLNDHFSTEANRSSIPLLLPPPNLNPQEDEDYIRSLENRLKKLQNKKKKMQLNSETKVPSSIVYLDPAAFDPVEQYEISQFKDTDPLLGTEIDINPQMSLESTDIASEQTTLLQHQTNPLPVYSEAFIVSRRKSYSSYAIEERQCFCCTIS